MSPVRERNHPWQNHPMKCLGSAPVPQQMKLNVLIAHWSKSTTLTIIKTIPWKIWQKRKCRKSMWPMTS